MEKLLTALVTAAPGSVALLIALYWFLKHLRAEKQDSKAALEGITARHEKLTDRCLTVIDDGNKMQGRVSESLDRINGRLTRLEALEEAYKG